jgi:hypothetical protein
LCGLQLEHNDQYLTPLIKQVFFNPSSTSSFYSINFIHIKEGKREDEEEEEKEEEKEEGHCNKSEKLQNSFFFIYSTL